MAQTTVGMSSKNGKVEYSLDASTFVDMSGSSSSIDVTGGDRRSGDAFTASGDTPFITSGKRDAYEVTFRGIYSETTGDPQFFEAIQTVYESGAGVCVRWSPTAYDTVNQKRFTTADTAGDAAVGVITAFNYPSLDFSSGDAVAVELKVRCSSIKTEDHA